MKKVNEFLIPGSDIKVGDGNLFVIAGPCVIESEEHTIKMAETLKAICNSFSIPLIFKSSYDKANRSSIKSFRGPGLEKGMKILKKIKEKYNLLILTDVHSIEEIDPVAEIADIIQIPAFLCRQTELVLKAGKTGRVVNIKKGQFMAPDQMKAIAEKVYSTENNKVIITERGYSFGYHNLVVDMRAFPLLRNDDLPVVFDATHSLQLPGKDGETTGGMRDMIPYLARASVACGIDGIFMEVHDCPQCALCDSSNMISIETFKNLIPTLIDINTITKKVAF